MGITGKYNFAGIKQFGAKGLELALSAAFSGFAAAMNIPLVGDLIDFVIQQGVNWLANEGLIVLNIGAILVDGAFEQSDFDDAMTKALASVSANPNTLTDAQKKAIDATVIAAFRKFADLGAAT